MYRWILAIAMTGCDGSTAIKDTSSGGSSPGGDDTGSSSSPWSILADNVGKGVLLSAWSNGPEVIMVGGEMGGGPGMLVRYDGTTLCTEDAVTDRALWWIHGDREGEWYAVGEAGTALHVVDGTRTRIDIPTQAHLYGVWATEEQVIAVGGDPIAGTGEVWEYQGDGDWIALATDLPGTVFKIWDKWVVGVDVLYELNPPDLTAHTPMGRLLTTRGRAEDDVWAVGGLTSSLVAHWDGLEWTEQDSTGVGQPLNGVWTEEGEDVWVAGNFGTMAAWDGTQWQMPDFPLTSEHFHAVWGHNDEVLWMGGNLFSSSGSNYGTIARYGPSSTPMEPVPCE